MSYTTQQDLEHAAGGATRLVELADWDHDTVADPDVLDRAQREADGFVDMHLRRFSAADLAALRADPTDTIRRIASDEAIYQIKKRRGQVAITAEDIKDREARITELRDMRADKLRAQDQKTPRGRFVENDTDFARDKWGGG